jgi:hypothetical protein
VLRAPIDQAAVSASAVGPRHVQRHGFGAHRHSRGPQVDGPGGNRPEAEALIRRLRSGGIRIGRLRPQRRSVRSPAARPATPAAGTHGRSGPPLPLKPSELHGSGGFAFSGLGRGVGTLRRGGIAGPQALRPLEPLLRVSGCPLARLVRIGRVEMYAPALRARARKPGDPPAPGTGTARSWAGGRCAPCPPRPAR